MVDNISNISTIGQSAVAHATTKRDVLAAIKTASDRTGVDFTYLVNKASQESSFNPVAKARGSSATGLYQFIDQTWLKTIKTNGEEYGLGAYADKITVGSDGIARVANETDKKAILELRKDPEIAANMAAELAKDNKEALQAKVGGKIGSTEMYLAHFLGSGGAAELLQEMKTNPNAKAADLLPTAADANKSVFFDRETGEAKTVGQIYKTFAKKFDKTPELGNLDVQVASASSSKSRSLQTTRKTSRYAENNIESSLANEIAMSSISGSSNRITAGNGVTLDKTTQSPFAAMVLAQMDMETFALDAKDNMTKFGDNDNNRRKSVLNTLAQAAG